MVAFADLIKLPTLAQIKALVITGATNLGLPVTSWVPGDPSERWMEIIPRGIDGFLSNITTQAVRFFFFELTTDPGDPGDLSRRTRRPGRACCPRSRRAGGESRGDKLPMPWAR